MTPFHQQQSINLPRQDHNLLYKFVLPSLCTNDMLESQFSFKIFLFAYEQVRSTCPLLTLELNK